MARAKYIVILGPDGSGKTTVADGLAEQLAAEQKSWRMNFSFRLLPPLSRLMGRAQKAVAPEGHRDAGMVKPLRRSRAILLGIWYGIDHVLGHLVLKGRYQNSTVVFARSYHDFLYQRAYLNLPRAVPMFFLALGPKPDLIVAPLRDPQVIHDAKPELTAREIADQYTRIRNGLGRFRQFAEIDASEGIDETGVCSGAVQNDTLSSQNTFPVVA